ncbi:MAG: branched-chain amino acid aminotransferase [Actinomycetia bacterium]|nr:branched-chain amino acid aminotransferase [Actinomycetes bacterium]
MALQFTPPADPVFTPDDEIAAINADPGFGEHFCDHMAIAHWNPDQGWHDAALVPYGPLPLSAGGAVYHYAQEIFEGLKAYRHADGSIWCFRPEANAARFASSATRMALPPLPVEDFVEGVRALVELDARWVPGGDEQSLYLRPFMIADEEYIGVRATRQATFAVIGTPVGVYFKGGVAPVDIWVCTDAGRVAPGGTGMAKCGGNYAASLLSQEIAHQHGCSQVLFTDAATHTWIEELGGMNFVCITAAGELVTPSLNGDILAGITRDSILKAAPRVGLTPVERPLSLEEVRTGITSGAITEIFACGTAAAIAPIGALLDESGEWRLPSASAGPKTLALREFLLDVQYGRRPDDFGWTQRIC